MEKVVLIIRDGWGDAKAGPHNAVTNAKTPNMTKYLAEYPHTQIEASGEQVGLPAGYMGSSEVGHLNMGAGRIVVQELKRLKDTIEDGSLFKSAPFAACIDNCLQNHKPLHVMGLVQDEGVHAHQDHLHAIMKYAAEKGIDMLVCYGSYAAYMAKSAEALGIPCCCSSDKETILNFLNFKLREGDVVLFKASRGIHMEEIIEGYYGK